MAAFGVPSPPPPGPAPELCRTAGCAGSPVELRLCFSCLQRYRDGATRDDARVDRLAVALQADVDEHLSGFTPEFRDAMAVNFAAHLVALEHPVLEARAAWWRAFTDTLSGVFTGGLV